MRALSPTGLFNAIIISRESRILDAYQGTNRQGDSSRMAARKGIVSRKLREFR
jgi:hypothetical protein